MINDRFDEEIRALIEHCSTDRVQLSSSIGTALDCDPYRRLVAMGRKVDILPLIRAVYDGMESVDPGFLTLRDHCLSCLVRDIAGERFQIPEAIQGQIYEIADYTKAWLDKALSEK